MNKLTQRLSALMITIGGLASVAYADQLLTDDYIVQGLSLIHI